MEIIDIKSGNGAFYVAKVDGGFIAGVGDKPNEKQKPRTAQEVYDDYRPLIESHQAWNICYTIQDYI